MLCGVVLFPLVPEPLGLIVDGVVEPGTAILLLPFGLVGATVLGTTGVVVGDVLAGSVEFPPRLVPLRLDLVEVLPDFVEVPLLFGVIVVPLPPGLMVVPGAGVPAGVVPFGVTPGVVVGVCAFALLIVKTKSRLVAIIANFFINFVV